MEVKIGSRWQQLTKRKAEIVIDNRWLGSNHMHTANTDRREQKEATIHPAIDNEMVVIYIFTSFYCNSFYVSTFELHFLQTQQRWYRLHFSIMMRGKVITKGDIKDVYFP